MKRLNISFFLVLLVSRLFAQDYIEYHRIFNRIDEDVLSGNYRRAIQRLDSIYANYDFIYAKHCMKAVQICVTVDDSIRADKWLQKSFRQGIPFWMIRTNELARKTLTYSTTQKTLNSFDSLHDVHIASIDMNLRNTIDSLLTIDQKYTRRINDGFVLFKPVYWLQWGRYNKHQFRILKQLIETYGYPEERLIGLPAIQDSVAFSRHFVFWGPSEIRNSTVQIMLQHCYSTWHKIDLEFKDTLYQNLLNGNMPAFQYALIVDFMVPDKMKHLDNIYWASSDFCNGKCSDVIDRNRYLIGLNSSAQEKKNDKIEIERRKAKKANSEIVLE